MVIESFCKARLRRGGFGVVGRNQLLNRCSAFILDFLEKRKKRQLSWKKQKKKRKEEMICYLDLKEKDVTLYIFCRRGLEFWFVVDGKRAFLLQVVN